MSTSVVLVCVTNKTNKVLTHDKFFKSFSNYGVIQRILIFERTVIWKVFIEFQNPDQAYQARQALNGTEFTDDPNMKMNVYASQLQRITFQENNSGGVGNQYFHLSFIYQDYTILRQKIEEKTKEVNTPIIKSSDSNPSSPNEKPIPYLSFTQQFQQIPNPNTLFFQQQVLPQQTQNQELFLQQKKIKHLLSQLNSVNTQIQHAQPYSQQQQQLVNKQQQLLSQLNDEQIYYQQSLGQYNSLQYKSQQKDYLGEITFLRSLNESPQKSSEEGENFEIDENDEEVKNDVELYQCFSQQKDMLSQLDTKKLLNNLNINVDQSIIQQSKQEIIEMIENDIQEDANQKISESVNQIDQIIEDGKKNQIQQFSQPEEFQQSQQYFPWIYQNRQQKGPVKQDPIQLYDDVTENMDPGNYVNPLFLKGTTLFQNINQVVRTSKVIYARWFDKNKVTLNMLYNVFGTFGNVEKMIYLKVRSSALIQYESIQHANQAKDSLNEINFFGQQLKVIQIISLIILDIFFKL